MTFAGNTTPRRRVKPKPEPWRCGCRGTESETDPQECADCGGLCAGDHDLRPAHLSRCSDCGAKRP